MGPVRSRRQVHATISSPSSPIARSREARPYHRFQGNRPPRRHVLAPSDRHASSARTKRLRRAHPVVIGLGTLSRVAGNWLARGGPGLAGFTAAWRRKGPLPILLLGGRRFSARLTARGRSSGGQAASWGRWTPPWTLVRVKWGCDGSLGLAERGMGRNERFDHGLSGPSVQCTRDARHSCAKSIR